MYCNKFNVPQHSTAKMCVLSNKYINNKTYKKTNMTTTNNNLNNKSKHNRNKQTTTTTKT